MKRLFASLIVFGVIAVVATYFFSRPPQLVLGIYDPGAAFTTEPRFKLESVFFATSVSPDLIASTSAQIISRHRTPLLTLEPWTAATTAQTITLCQKLNSLNAPHIIRWGHEMELKNGRYPWSGKNPTEFITWYRTFVSTCKAADAQAQFMWSPAGDTDSEKYWPGADVVDIIGLSAYSRTGESFEETVSGKYNRVKAFNTPVYIAELGVTNSDQQAWLSTAVSSLRQFPLLTGIVYFNSEDQPGVWGSSVSTPDWRITSTDLTPLLSIANTN